jgi:hypothetical protein
MTLQLLHYNLIKPSIKMFHFILAALIELCWLLVSYTTTKWVEQLGSSYLTRNRLTCNSSWLDSRNVAPSWRHFGRVNVLCWRWSSRHVFLPSRGVETNGPPSLWNKEWRWIIDR